MNLRFHFRPGCRLTHLIRRCLHVDNRGVVSLTTATSSTKLTETRCGTEMVASFAPAGTHRHGVGSNDKCVWQPARPSFRWPVALKPITGIGVSSPINPKLGMSIPAALVTRQMSRSNILKLFASTAARFQSAKKTNIVNTDLLKMINDLGRLGQHNRR